MSRRNEQYRFEIETWQRALEYQLQEHIYMKVCIAEMTKHDVSSEELTQLEHFNNLILNKEMVITLLRRDLQELPKAVIENSTFKIRLKSLRKDMEQMENEFIKLKSSFSRYVQVYS